MPPAEAAYVLQDVFNRFFLHLDESRYAELAALMAPGGTWLRQGTLLKGRDAILAALETRPANFLTVHMVSNLIVDGVSGEHLEGGFNATVFAHDVGAGETMPYPMDLPNVVSRYRAAARRIDGTWLIASLAGQYVFRRDAH